ncbi:MAG: hypothetical protein ACYSSN_02915 [Planctomycetota bacterium]
MALLLPGGLALKVIVEISLLIQAKTGAGYVLTSRLWCDCRS